MPVLDNHKSNPLNINLQETNLGSPVIISDKSIQKIGFNVMADRKVEELLYIKEYRVWDNAIETIFDREYYTEMDASPDHLIFLSALVNLQKMVYVYMHHYLGIEYSDDSIKPNNILQSMKRENSSLNNLIDNLKLEIIL